MFAIKALANSSITSHNYNFFLYGKNNSDLVSSTF